MAESTRSTHSRFDRLVCWLTRQAWQGRLPWRLVNPAIDLVRGVQIARILRGRGR